MIMERESLNKYLQELANRSRSGSINWNQPTPSTFQWVSKTDNGEMFVTIQRASLPMKEMLSNNLYPDRTKNISWSFLFQVINKTSKQTVVSLSSKERPDLYNDLSEIYNSAEVGMDIHASSVLRNLLDF